MIVAGSVRCFVRACQRCTAARHGSLVRHAGRAPPRDWRGRKAAASAYGQAARCGGVDLARDQRFASLVSSFSTWTTFGSKSGRATRSLSRTQGAPGRWAWWWNSASRRSWPCRCRRTGAPSKKAVAEKRRPIEVRGRRDLDASFTLWQTWQRPTLPRLETEYHRRWGVSRPSSEWDRVQPPRNNHQVGKKVKQTGPSVLQAILTPNLSARRGARRPFASRSFRLRVCWPTSSRPARCRASSRTQRPR